nr:MAG TPA: hypothetical protein [Caudoviricetes sp.]DAW93572.1 MAG TPA: hypothetical protein [Bacteriophage sp.]
MFQFTHPLKLYGQLQHLLEILVLLENDQILFK